MRQTTTLAMTVIAAAILAGCGGSDFQPKPKFSAQVSFGDSLSDVGTHAVGAVKTAGGGKYTINGDNTASNPELTGKNWTELTAAQFGLPAPCAAQTGLQGDASKGFSVPIVNHAGCYGYAQGGSRVTNPIGADNKATGSILGQLTVPVVQQVKNHLAAVGGKFKGDEIVFVMAGGNDVLSGLTELNTAATAAGTTAGANAFGASLVGQLAAGAPNPQSAAQAIGLALATENARPGHTDQTVIGAAVTAAVVAGNGAVASSAVYLPMVAKAQADANAAGFKAGNDYANAHGADLVKALAQAGAELAVIVKSQIVANGAKYIVVNNLPDVATTPSVTAQSPSIQALTANMVKVFNDALAAGLAGETTVLLIDVFTFSHDQALNPAAYGFTNTKDTACDLSPAKNLLSSSLTCNGSNLKAGDVSHYEFADGVHPTPFGNKLLARYVGDKVAAKGWL
ncbi:MAG: SGNH/GDSL hydrolase family protein [Pseudomonadota bacterium]